MQLPDCYLLEVHRCAWNTSSYTCCLTWHLFPPVPDATPWFCYLLEVHRCARNTTSSSCWHVWSLFSLAPDAAPRILLPAGGGQVCVRHAAGRWLAECRYHTHHGPYRAPHLLHPGTGAAGNFLSFFVIVWGTPVIKELSLQTAFEAMGALGTLVQCLCVFHNPSISGRGLQDLWHDSFNACMYTRGQGTWIASQHIVLMQINSGFSCDRGRDRTISLWMSSQVLFDWGTLHPPPPRMTWQFHFGSAKEWDIAVHDHEGIALCSSVLWFGGGGEVGVH